jgi:hypothetical protein
MASPVTLKKSGPGLAPLAQRLKEIRESQVYVGIPASKTIRRGEAINNSSLMFIMEHGSPLQNIPKREVLRPSIKLSQRLFAPHLGAAAKFTLEKKPTEALRELNIAGTIAANGAKRYILVGSNLVPNAPSTIKAKGSDRPLVDEGKLVAAITHVVVKNSVEVKTEEVTDPTGQAVTGKAPSNP